MRKPKAPRLVTIAIFTTITIVFWIFVSLYSILTSTPNVQIPPEILEPLSPTFDTGVLNDLSSKVFFEEGQTSPLVGVPTISPTPVPTTSQAQFENPVATQEGQIVEEEIPQ